MVDAMNVAALTGTSGSGKTTLIVALIEAYRAEGLRVGAIKHTHHPLNNEDRGDTRRFRLAGADPVLLVSSSGPGFVVHSRGEVRRLEWHTPEDLLKACSGCDVVLVEGFKGLDAPWPKVAITGDERPTVAELVSELARIWTQS